MGERVYPYRVEDGPPIHYPPPLEPHAYQHGTSIPAAPGPTIIDKEEQEQKLIGSHPASNQPVFYQEDGWNAPQQLPPRPRRRRRSRCLRCCCCLCAFLGTCVVLLGVLVLVLFLVLRPKLPKYTITQAEIHNFTIANATSSSMQEGTLILNADTQFLVSMRNPNKKIGIDYRSITAALFYEGLQIGQGSIPRFYQGHKNTTYVELPMVGHDIVLTPSLGTILRQSLTNDDSLTLHARAIVRVRIKIGHWKSHTSKVRVKCHIQISNPRHGNVRLLNDGCKFKLLRLRL